MKQVEIILKSGKSVVTECEDIGITWAKDGTLTWLEMDGARPEVDFLDLESVACVSVMEMKNRKRAGREAAAGAAAPLLQSAT